MTSGSLNKAVHVHTYVRPRYCRLLAILVGIIVLAHFLFVPFSSTLTDAPYLRKSDFARSLRSRGVGGEVLLGGDSWKKIGDWCTEEEYLDGEWVKREEEVTMENIRRIFHYTVSLPLIITSKAPHTHGLPGSRRSQVYGQRHRVRRRPERRRSKNVSTDLGDGTVRVSPEERMPSTCMEPLEFCKVLFAESCGLFVSREDSPISLLADDNVRFL